MKKRMILAVLAAGIMAFTGCNHHINEYDNYIDITPPHAPANVSVLALDNEAEVYWDRSPDSDVAGYNVYYAYEYNGHYTLLGNTRGTSYVDGGNNGPSNGVKYFYAVAAYDYDGNESELSGTYAFGIPRPDGFNVSLYEYTLNSARGGFDFSAYSIVDYNNENTDMFLENYQGKWYLDIWKDSDIKDMGPTIDITDITTAPVSGYVPLYDGDNIKYAEAIPGHTYVIRTWDNHFAKVRISQIASDRVIFDWAYQLIAGERLMKEGKNEARAFNFGPVKANRQ